MPLDMLAVNIYIVGHFYAHRPPAPGEEGVSGPADRREFPGSRQGRRSPHPYPRPPGNAREPGREADRETHRRVATRPGGGSHRGGDRRAFIGKRLRTRLRRLRDVEPTRAWRDA